MSVLDIFLVVPLLWAIYKGFKRGLIIEVATLIALGLGIYGAVRYSSLTADFVRQNVEVQESYMPLISFVLTFVAIVVVVFVGAKLLEKVVNLVALKLVNKLAGAAFGFVKMSLILSMVLLILHLFDKQFSIIPNDTKEKSVLYGPVSSIAPIVIPGISSADWYEALMEQVPESFQPETETEPDSTKVDQGNP